MRAVSLDSTIGVEHTGLFDRVGSEESRYHESRGDWPNRWVVKLAEFTSSTH